jgi:hypothetical protein
VTSLSVDHYSASGIEYFGCSEGLLDRSEETMISLELVKQMTGMIEAKQLSW